MVNRETLQSGDELHTIWQTNKDDSVPECAINITEYSGNRVLELQQDKDVILVNFDTLPELIKVLRHYQWKEK